MTYRYQNFPGPVGILLFVRTINTVHLAVLAIPTQNSCLST
jgi:hypothetical protein